MKQPDLLYCLRLLCLPALLAGAMLQSCSKDKVVVPNVPYADTTGILTGNKWHLVQFWEDMNNNERIDSGEIIADPLYYTAYLFYTNGVVRDSTAKATSRTGTWYYKDNYKTAFYTHWDSRNTDLHYIRFLDDSTLTTKRSGTNETWYFKRVLR
jgi:hypothetical protein